MRLRKLQQWIDNIPVEDRVLVAVLVILLGLIACFMVYIPTVRQKQKEREKIVHRVAVKNGADVSWEEWQQLDYREREAMLSGSGYRHRK